MKAFSKKGLDYNLGKAQDWGAFPTPMIINATLNKKSTLVITALTGLTFGRREIRPNHYVQQFGNIDYRIIVNGVELAKGHMSRLGRLGTHPGITLHGVTELPKGDHIFEFQYKANGANYEHFWTMNDGRILTVLAFPG